MLSKHIWGKDHVGDLDGDGKQEVVFGNDGDTIYCLDGATGTRKWFNYLGPSEGIIWSGPAIADVDGDGQKEVIIGNTDPDGKVYCITSGGTMKWFYQTNMGSVHTPGSLADVDGDNKLEFLVPNALSDTLVCLNAEDGSVLWKKAVVSDVHSPFPADIDGDECVEIIVGTHPDAGGYSLFALDDPANAQGCGPLKVEEESHALGPVLTVRGNGLCLFLPGDARVSLALYDAQGRLAQRFYDGVLVSGGHTFVPRTEAKGVYLAVLRYPGGLRTVKAIVQ